MSADEEISALQMFEIMRKESAEWRDKTDKMFKDSNELTTLSHNMLREELVAVKKTVNEIKITTDVNSKDIAFVNDLKLKASWGLNTAKFATVFIAGAFAFFAGIYHFWEFLKDYFTAKHG